MEKTYGSHVEISRILTISCAILFILLVVLTIYLNVAISLKELRISNYDRDIPKWLVVMLSGLFSAFFIFNFRRYSGLNNIYTLLGFIVASISALMVFSQLSYVIDEYLAFSGSPQMVYRKMALIGKTTESRKGAVYYKGIINNNGYIAILRIREPLYQLIGSSTAPPCVGLSVQRNRKNERILFSHNVLDVSDVVPC